MSELVPSIESKYGPRATLDYALSQLYEQSPDMGAGRPEWQKSPLFRAWDNVLAKGKELIGNQSIWLLTTTFVLNPILQSDVAGMEIIYKTLEAGTQAIKSIPAIGEKIVNALQTFATGPFPWNTTALIMASNPALVNLALVAGSAAQVFSVVAFGFEQFQKWQRKERMKLGVEPLRPKEKPRFTMIGPSELLSRVAKVALPEKQSYKNPDVLVHADNVLPSSYGKQIEYHFNIANNPQEIVTEAFMKKSGIDRSNNIVFVAFDPDKALFYGREASAALTPSMFTTMLALLSHRMLPDQPKRPVTIIAPKNATFLTHTTSQHELFRGFSEKGLEVTVRTPEDILLEHIADDIRLLRAGKPTEKQIRVNLVGGADTSMLKQFKKGIEGVLPNTMVNIISDQMIGDRAYAEDQQPEENIAALQALTREADINYIYGDTDAQTTDLANLLISVHKTDRKKTIALIERHESILDASASSLYHVCIYDMLADAISTMIRPPKPTV
ncbi:MAG: hypothetical protein Q8L37_06555 [Candidatus Gottesmanbacteria bacterium]|nr:hypothetical protein [Candidatus Gottesmanbacteria bacterium]